MDGRGKTILRRCSMLVTILVVGWFWSFALYSPWMTQTELLLAFWPRYLFGGFVILLALLVGSQTND